MSAHKLMGVLAMHIDFAARRNDRRPLHLIIRDAMAERGGDAECAYDLLCDVVGGQLPGVNGCPTVERIAVRLWCGCSINDAVAREYLYRWSLALQSPGFGVPHALGL